MKLRSILLFHLPFLIICLVAFFLRFHRISILTTFGRDQGIDFLTVKEMIVDHKLTLLGINVSIADFLRQNFDAEKDAHFINSIKRMVEGYDAADPEDISTFTLRDEWLMKPSIAEIVGDNRIKEGYGGLLNFLEQECKKNGVEIKLDSQVKTIEHKNQSVSVVTMSGEIFTANKIVVTVPLPVIKDIAFVPEIKDTLAMVNRIGFGSAIKLLLKFKTRWWEYALETDLSKMSFMLCNEEFMTWWTQYPEIEPVLVGWMAGPSVKKFKETSPNELLDIALVNLSSVFKIDKNKLKEDIVHAEVINWEHDQFSKGAYSYTTYKTKDAYEKLREPINDTVFFAGEALYTGEITATVEGALGSGLETVHKILGRQ